MAACGSIGHIFEKPLPESPSFLESLTPWKHIKKPIDDSSFTEIFGELNFKENSSLSSSISSLSSSSPKPESPSSSSSSSSSSFWAPNEPIQNKGCDPIYYPARERKQYGNSESFSSMNTESLSLCTEGLGFESFDDVEDLLNNKEWENQEMGKSVAINDSNSENHSKECSRMSSSRTRKGSFPPPISCIGQSGKPWVCFKSYREDGRFILKEIRIPTQEFLHACRENGRLKLQFIQSDDEILEEDEDEADEENNIEGSEEKDEEQNV